MSNVPESPLARHRERMTRAGMVRVELRVRKEDAPLLRDIARALRDPDREAKTRALLRQRFAERRGRGLKALLAAAPLEGIDLERARDVGRRVEL